MTLYILDPNLVDGGGHHLTYDLRLAREAVRREQPVTIIANKSFDPNLVSEPGVSIVPAFDKTTYAPTTPDISARYNEFLLRNESISEILFALPRDNFSPFDVVLVPTISEFQLFGVLTWMKSFDASLAPLFVVHLMFPSGLAGPDDPPIDPLTALFYVFAFRVSDSAGASVLFFAGDVQYAQEFSRLANKTIAVHPSQFGLEPRRWVKDSIRTKRAVLYAGDVKREKGAYALPKLVGRLIVDFPEWTFVVHINPTFADPLAYGLVEALKPFQTEPQFEMYCERLSDERFLDLLNSADIFVFTYESQAYAQKSSGVLWEAISAGTVLVLPERTWLEREAKHWDCGTVAYSGDIDGISEAFGLAWHNLDALQLKSAAAAERYRGENSVKAIFDQFGSLWARRMAMASLSLAKELDLADQGFVGWHPIESSAADRTRWRWTGLQSDFMFDWNLRRPWSVQIKVAQYFVEKQLTDAQIFVNGSKRSFRYTVGESGSAEIVLSSNQEDLSEFRFTVSIKLPCTYRPDPDPRDLGILVTSIVVCLPRQETEVWDEIEQPIIESPTESDGTGGARVRGIISGSFSGSLSKANEFIFIICAPSPEVVRATQLFVNGVPVRLEMRIVARAEWEARGIITETTLVRGGWRSSWDIWIPDGIEVRIKDIRLASPETRSPIRFLGVGERVEFGKGASGATLLGKGWSTPEESWCWMTGLSAEIKFTSRETIESGSLSFECMALATQEEPISVEFFIGARRALTQEWRSMETGVVLVPVWPGEIVFGNTTTIHLRASRLRSAPGDIRRLALLLVSLILQKQPMGSVTPTRSVAARIGNRLRKLFKVPRARFLN
jgi:glycosyltransferase involved in cell wall biosynthesis